MTPEEHSYYRETPDIETSSDDYAQRFKGKIGKWLLKVQEEVVLKAVSNWPGAMILDVGGGHGQMVEPLIREGYRVTVLGSAPICRKRIQNYVDNNSCSFMVGNIINLPFVDKSFDIVISLRLVPHVTAWPKLLSEFTRVARSAVIIDYPSLRSINYIAPMLFGFKKKIEVNTRPFGIFHEKDIVEIFNSNGFIRVSRYPQFFFPIVFHRLMKFQAFSALIERLCRMMGLTAWLGSPVVLKLVPEAGQKCSGDRNG